MPQKITSFTRFMLPKRILSVLRSTLAGCGRQNNGFVHIRRELIQDTGSGFPGTPESRTRPSGAHQANCSGHGTNLLVEEEETMVRMAKKMRSEPKGTAAEGTVRPFILGNGLNFISKPFSKQEQSIKLREVFDESENVS